MIVIEYLKRAKHYSQKDSVEKDVITDLAVHNILDEPDVRLENQPETVCKLVGTLIDVLVKKGLLNVEDLYEIGILDSYYQENAKIIRDE